MSQGQFIAETQQLEWLKDHLEKQFELLVKEIEQQLPESIASDVLYRIGENANIAAQSIDQNFAGEYA